MKTLFIKSCIILLFILTKQQSEAQYPLTLPDIISDHAVFQRNTTINLWGKGPAGQLLKIVGTWNNHDTIKLVIDNDCMWQIQIKTPDYEGSFNLLFICGRQLKTVNDVLLGDVWLCSGQSNMEFNMNWGIDTSMQKYKILPNHKIRFFQVERNFDKLPVSEAKGSWKICDTKTAMEFSTVGYFMGRKLQESTHLAIGLIGSYWGGTNIQAWMPKECFQIPTLNPNKMHMDPYEGAPRGYSILYNGMVNPIINYAIKGCIWYQGETNVDYDWNKYGALLSSMITSWRFRMNNNFPFYTIQIAPWNGYVHLRAAALREQEEKLIQTIPNYETISILDLVDDTTNLHPKIKREIGDRIGNLVLNKTYHYKDIPAIAPHIESVTVKNNDIVLTYISQGFLSTKDKNINGFEIAGDDKIFYNAQASLHQDKKLIISAKEVKNPLYIRYCFKNAAVPNLFDETGLPLKWYRNDNFVIE